MPNDSIRNYNVINVLQKLINYTIYIIPCVSNKMSNKNNRRLIRNANV